MLENHDNPMVQSPEQPTTLDEVVEGISYEEESLPSEFELSTQEPPAKKRHVKGKKK